MNMSSTVEKREIRFQVAEDVTLAADSYGDSQRPPVILLHGGGQTRHAWGGTAQTLGTRGFHAIAIDQRGHGRSGWPEDGDYEIGRFAEDLLAVARSLDQSPIVVGASLGGMAGLLAQGELAAAPVFRALVLVDITPTIEPEGVDKIMGFMSSNLEEGFGSLEEAADAIAAYLPHRPKPKSLDGLKKNLRRGEDGRYRWHWDPRFVSGVRQPGAARDPSRMIKAAKNLKIPALLVRGRMSDLVSEEHAQEFLTLVPHAKFEDITDAGHMVAGDKNDVFTDAVVNFLTTLDA